jgi:hypothetical protein
MHYLFLLGVFLLSGVLLSLAFWVLVIALVLCGAGEIVFEQLFASAVTWSRIIGSLVLLAPYGFVLGMAFPLGMPFVQQKSGHYAAWLWGINGAASVTGSVLAVCIGLHCGLRMIFYVAVVCYCLAAYLAACRGRRST